MSSVKNNSVLSDSHITKKRVISCQSHVVSGFVGNRCCVLPLQVLGIEVDFINLVQFSNHKGYKYFTGQTLKRDEFRELFDGLKTNDLLHYSCIITGYLGSMELLEEICNVVKDLKSKTNTIYYCDPVLGDSGQLYLPSKFIQLYRDLIIPLADVLFPNQYEAEWLSGIKVKSEKDVLDMMQYFHSKNVKTVILTSTDFYDLNSKNLYGYASIKYPDTKQEVYKFQIQKQPYNFAGTGDLFAALFLAWSLKIPNNTAKVISNVLSTVQYVLKETIKNQISPKKSLGYELKPNDLELDIVSCIAQILNPTQYHVDKIM